MSPRTDIGVLDDLSRMQLSVEGLAALADALSLAVIATKLDGTVVYWNSAATRLYLWPIKEAIGRNIVSLTPSLQSKNEAQHVMETLRAGQPWQGEIVLRRRDGSPFTAYVTDVPTGGDDALLVGVSGPADKRRALHAATSAFLSALYAHHNR